MNVLNAISNLTVPPRLQKFDTLEKVILAIDSGAIRMAFMNNDLKETTSGDIWYWRDLAVTKEGPLFTLRTAIEKYPILTLHSSVSVAISTDKQCDKRVKVCTHEKPSDSHVPFMA